MQQSEQAGIAKLRECARSACTRTCHVSPAKRRCLRPDLLQAPHAASEDSAHGVPSTRCPRQGLDARDLRSLCLADAREDAKRFGKNTGMQFMSATVMSLAIHHTLETLMKNTVRFCGSLHFL